ncbi:MAG: hypothetical protein KGO93_06285 [Cyanobacteria bacterium REEB446]|nr:hypothetical protein [Cyanobacteria bacterium REEB446]
MLVLFIFLKNYTEAEMISEYRTSRQREINAHDISRADNSDHKLTYYEKRLYPQQDFSSDSILMRIERLEIALFGRISDEELLNERVLKIESEMALLELNSSKRTAQLENEQRGKIKELKQEKEMMRENKLKREREMIREANLKRENRRRNYSMINPLIQGASQRLLRMI